MKCTTIIRGRHVRLDAIGASARTMTAFSGFYESHEPPPLALSDVCSIMPGHRHSHQKGQQSWYILRCWFVCCHPGGRRGDTERVVAWWRRPVASGVALVMLHWAMRSVSLWYVRVAIKMAHVGIHLFATAALFDCHIHSLRPCYGPLKLIGS